MSSTEFPVDKILLGIVQCIGYQSYNCGWRRRINMKLKRLAALVLAVMMTLTAASVTGLSKLAAEGTQKPEKSVVDAAGATWYHADAGEELRFDDDSSYCFESESWIMRQKSGNTIDEAVFDGITPDNVQTLTDESAMRFLTVFPPLRRRTDNRIYTPFQCIPRQRLLQHSTACSAKKRKNPNEPLLKGTKLMMKA